MIHKLEKGDGRTETNGKDVIGRRKNSFHTTQTHNRLGVLPTSGPVASLSPRRTRLLLLPTFSSFGRQRNLSLRWTRLLISHHIWATAHSITSLYPSTGVSPHLGTGAPPHSCGRFMWHPFHNRVPMHLMTPPHSWALARLSRRTGLISQHFHWASKSNYTTLYLDFNENGCTTPMICQLGRSQTVRPASARLPDLSWCSLR